MGTLENAGIAPSSLVGSATAVYMGITTADYAMRMVEFSGFPGRRCLYLVRDGS